MRWLPFLILGYVALGLHVALKDFISYQGAAPNLVLLALVVMIHGWIHPAAAAAVENGVPLAALRDAPGTLFITAVYTALLAPGILWLLSRSRRLFAFPNRRAREWG